MLSKHVLLVAAACLRGSRLFRLAAGKFHDFTVATLMLAGLAAGSVPAGAQQYSVTEIPAPTVPVGIATAPPIGYALNASGEVTGQFAAQPFYNGVADGARHLFVYSHGTTVDLGADDPAFLCVSNGSGAIGLGINAQGDITGDLCAGTQNSIAFVKLNGASGYGPFVPFDSVIQQTYPNLVASVGNSINVGDQVAGTLELPSSLVCGSAHPFIYDQSTGVLHDFFSSIQLAGGCSAYATAISDAGQVAGQFWNTQSLYTQAYVYNPATGITTPIPYLPGGILGEANAISSNGLVVTGYSQNSGAPQEGFVYTQGGVTTDIGNFGGVGAPDTASVGNGVNSSGQVTGEAYTVNGGPHAFLYSNGAIHDLNTLIPAVSAATYTLTNGVAINDAGQILVLATKTATGQEVTLLLTPSAASVPNVVGDTQAAATSALTAAGFVLGTATTQASTTVAPGTVIGQDPGAGTSAASGSAVNLVVSSGVTVPNLVGLPLSAASVPSSLFLGAVTQQYSSVAPQGTIIAQSPVAGSSVAGGTAINLVISQGPAPVLTQVPNIFGDTQTSAMAALVGAELTLGTVGNEASSTVPWGEVSSQSPPAGDSVTVGSAVNVILSSGPPQMSVGLAGAPQFTYNGSAWVVAIGIKNNGNVTADNIRALVISLNGVPPLSGAGEVVEGIAPGSAQYIAVTFPATVTSGTLKLSGIYTAGTLSGNWTLGARVAVPPVP